MSEDFVMLETLEGEGGRSWVGHNPNPINNCFSRENKEQWTYAIPVDLLRSIENLLKDLPWEGKWTI